MSATDHQLDSAPVEDPTAADSSEAAALLPAAVMAQTLPDYLRASVLKIRSGDSGVLPVVLGLVIIAVVFQAISPRHIFLSANNLVALLQQSAVFIVLGMAEIFALLLGEIDLSIGFVGAVGAEVTLQLVQPNTTNWPWWAAVLAGLATCAVVGFLQGTLVSRLRLPSFIVTLGGFLVFNGVLLKVLQIGPFSGGPTLISNDHDVKVLSDFMQGHLSVAASWILMIVVLALVGGSQLYRDLQRRRSGLVAPPLAITLLRLGLMAVAGIAVVLICNVNRNVAGAVKNEGTPYFVYIVLGVLLLWTFLLQRTRYGRYVYAIGGNAEAARRAGVNVPMVRTIAFVLVSVTAGIGLLLYASQLGGLTNNVQGGQYVLYAVAAAVIGGTSLFGGRGKAVHGLLGGLVIGGIYNGMYLLGLSVEWEFIVTGLVLLGAVTIDALSRRGAATPAR